MTFWIGVDPGAQGCIAVIDGDGQYVDHWHFNGNWKEAIKFLEKFLSSNGANGILINLEKSQPIGFKQAAFGLGVNFGGWKAVLEAYDLSYVLTPPQAWQPKLLGRFPKGESKKAALEYINKRFPELDLKTKKDQGTADALCLALYILKFK